MEMSAATEAPLEQVETSVRQVPAGQTRILARWAGWAALAAITAGAAALRLAHLGQVIGDPFYDGAVRSMGLSWHNFYFGAVEPSGAIAIDKPPVDLWLQVASVKLLGFGSAALKTPEALAGTLAVPLLYAAVAPVFGVRAGLASALALAVLPIEVITARSDTMDAVMMALTVLALALLVRAARSGRTVWLLGAAAALGIAFDVKLLESVVALPGLALLAWLGLPGARRRRVVQLALATVVYVVVALAWLTGTLLFAAHDRPWAYGSTNGSAWNSAFVFNGLDRLEGKSLEGAQTSYQPSRHYPEATQTERDAIPILAALADTSARPRRPALGRAARPGGARRLLLGGAALGALLWERRTRARPRDTEQRLLAETGMLAERGTRSARRRRASPRFGRPTGGADAVAASGHRAVQRHGPPAPPLHRGFDARGGGHARDRPRVGDRASRPRPPARAERDAARGGAVRRAAAVRDERRVVDHGRRRGGRDRARLERLPPRGHSARRSHRAGARSACWRSRCGPRSTR